VAALLEPLAQLSVVFWNPNEVRCVIDSTEKHTHRHQCFLTKTKKTRPTERFRSPQHSHIIRNTATWQIRGRYEIEVPLASTAACIQQNWCRTYLLNAALPRAAVFDPARSVFLVDQDEQIYWRGNHELIQGYSLRNAAVIRGLVADDEWRISNLPDPSRQPAATQSSPACATRYFGWCEPARRGATCRKNSATGTRFFRNFGGGPTAASGMSGVCDAILLMIDALIRAHHCAGGSRATCSAVRAADSRSRSTPAPMPKARDWCRDHARQDGGHDSEAVRQDIEQRGDAAVIPSLVCRKIQHAVDKAAYALRNRKFCAGK
jgi:hypothetical protein